MTEVKHLIGEYWAVEIPEDANKFDLCDFHFPNYQTLYYNSGGQRMIIEVHRQEGVVWSIVSTSDEMPVVEILHIVEKENDESGHLNSWWYKNYLVQGIWTKDPVESFQSLLKSHGLEGRQLIIKKEL